MSQPLSTTHRISDPCHISDDYGAPKGVFSVSNKMRSELGCSMIILFAPLFLFGALVLANTSDDSISTIDVVSSYVLFAFAVLTFIAGIILWLRYR